MEYTVDVNESCIERGTPNSCTQCPIALAIDEQTDLSCAVYPKRIIALTRNGFNSVPITYNRALDFIRRFDSGKPVKPFLFKFVI
jgi:hypothetical protein